MACPDLLASIEDVVSAVTGCYRNGRRVFFCGNGGSAADAQHLAAELSGRFLLDRDPLPAEALHVNSSFLTAVSNDYGFERAFERAVAAYGSTGDVLFVLSTSGNSPNVLHAARKAREKGLMVVGMTGRHGGALRQACDLLLCMPEEQTPRIQEAHILCGHIICELVEASLFARP
ncbi:MAG: hypothetical protein RLY31_566 [Bacteroidota bacterium]|jgi:D-sedoheptulose 7-phosphate isomerase